MKYDFVAIEKRWQERWEKDGTFRVANPGDPGFDASKPKYYVLDMFPYPSGAGLHVGHPLGYIATDIVARYKRMKGFHVLHPMGFDAFGLPAEQYAVEHGVHPRKTTEEAIATYVRQLKRIGFCYDWDRSIATIEPTYYRWTQWIFLQIFHSWLDPWEQRARPIAELEAALAAGDIVAGPGRTLLRRDEAAARDDDRPWAGLEAAAKKKVIEGQRLAYLDDVTVNWCPMLGTVLANEEVTAEGRSERGDHPVYKRPMRQWMLRITAYAERLAADLDQIDWPESLVKMQREWIGRSEGAHADFKVAEGDAAIRVYTTRPDTLFGATYMVLAPEHELVSELTSDAQRAEVEAYRLAAETKSDRQRQEEATSGQKTGVFTGGYAINPVNDERIPVWVADYVLMGYGTGAIMAVPASDDRDFDFARSFSLPIRPVVFDPAWLAEQAAAAGWSETGDALRARYDREAAALPAAFTGGAGVAINSASDDVSLDGLATPEAKSKIIAWLEESGRGQGAVQYKLRDWLFSRQRYWGEPFPILHSPDGELVAVDESELPVELPPMDDFKPVASDDPEADPVPPLARAPEEWRVVERDGVPHRRELNTMPQWAGSCWYYLRFLDPKNSERFVGQEVERYWMRGPDDDPRKGVDLYVGGVEHAVLHLLYARFWHKVLYDLGHLSTPEPFGRLYNQGYILAHSYRNERGTYVPADEVEADGDGFAHLGQPVTQEMGKMGKSLKNSITPDDFCERYGADTLRLYEMYLGPVHKSKLWNTQDVSGVHRFLQRLWRNCVDPDSGELRVVDDPAPADVRRLLHRTIKAVSRDMEAMEMNTSIARMIELNNALVKLDTVPREVVEPLLAMLAPMAPHFAEELWSRLGHERSIADSAWPVWDEAQLVEASVTYPVQVNGKVRAQIEVPADADDAAIEAAARADDKVARHLDGKTVRRVIVVEGRLVNLVVG